MKHTIVLALLLTACGATVKPSLPVAIGTSVEYTTLAIHLVPGVKRAVDIRLPHKVAPSTLTEIAQATRASCDEPRLFITYYLPGMKVGAGAWATSHYNPQLVVQVLGPTKEQEQAHEQDIATAPTPTTEETLGTWYDDSAYVGGPIRIYRVADTIRLHQRFPDGSERTRTLQRRIDPRGVRFDVPGDGFGEYYLLVGSTGLLGVYDRDGLIKFVRPTKRR